MSFFSRFSRGQLPLTRLEAFSDGVFAIIVTLLVLELKVPALQNDDSVRELARQLIELLPKYLSWLLSFIIVCKFWLNHHHIFGLARHADYGLIWLNSFFLLFQSFVPFPTALMGEYPDNPLAVSFFGAVMAVNTLLFIALHAYILRHMLKPERAATVPRNIIPKSFLGVGFYLLGSAAAWYNVYLAFALYMITPFFFLVPPEAKPAATTKK